MQQRIIINSELAPYGAGLLGAFGGWLGEGEAITGRLIREVKEETSLNPDELGIKLMSDFVIPASKDFDRDRHYYLYQGNVASLDFEVYEGGGAEAFTLSEASKRNDLTLSTTYIFDHIDISV